MSAIDMEYISTSDIDLLLVVKLGATAKLATKASEASL